MSDDDDLLAGKDLDADDLLEQLKRESKQKELAKKEERGHVSPDRERADLIEELQLMDAALDRTPQTRDLRALRRSRDPYYREFGSWPAALRAAGIEPTPRQTRWEDDDDE